jgi:hypothetical protein
MNLCTSSWLVYQNRNVPLLETRFGNVAAVRWPFIAYIAFFIHKCNLPGRLTPQHASVVYLLSASRQPSSRLCRCPTQCSMLQVSGPVRNAQQNSRRSPGKHVCGYVCCLAPVRDIGNVCMYVCIGRSLHIGRIRMDIGLT